MMLDPLSQAGLTRETLFNSNKSLPFWLQYAPDDFIQVIVHEIKEEVVAIEEWAKLLCGTPGVDNLVLGSNPPITAKDGCVAISDKGKRLRDILDLAWDYAEARKARDKTP